MQLSQKGFSLLLLLAGVTLLLFLIITSMAPFKHRVMSMLFPKDASKAAENWAFEETFDSGTPASPSQPLLPKIFDYVATHRNTGGGQSSGQNATDKPFPADHADDCTFPQVSPLEIYQDSSGYYHPVMSPDPVRGYAQSNQHVATTNHISDASNPDKSFFICNNHMMSSMGQVDGYSVSSFYPRQEFDFSSGNGVLEWDVNLNEGGRNWWEVMIVPREETQLGAARDWLPISETYPKNRIVFIWENTARQIKVGKTLPPPDGWVVQASDWRKWGEWVVKDDPALTDRRIRRPMRVTLTPNKITWEVQKPDGTYDPFSVDVPGGLPFTKGIVMFKTHSYTPDKAANFNLFTYHWDNIRFNGPKLAPYEAYEIPGVMQLNANGSVAIGSTKTTTLNLIKVGPNPVLLGQTYQGQPGQILLSINGNPNIEVKPHSSSSKDNPCYYDGWRTFRFSVNPSFFKTGDNTFKWTVGPRPTCATGQWWWDGFAVKAMEVQFDGTAAASPAASSQTSPSPVKPGDLDGNNKVDIFDYNILLTDFGKQQPELPADIDKSGKVDIFDYNTLLTNFGK